jgi:hypothetical protein
VNWNTRGTGALGLMLLLVSQSACTGTQYVREVPRGVAPPSTELRAAYCADVWRQETRRYESSQRAGSWLLGLGIGASVASGSTFLAATQTDRDKTDKTLVTVGGSLLLAGLAGVITGTVLLATNNHEKKAKRAAALATEIVAKGERHLPKQGESDRDSILEKRDAETKPLFQECLRVTSRNTFVAAPPSVEDAGEEEEAEGTDEDQSKHIEEASDTAPPAKPTGTTAAPVQSATPRIPAPALAPPAKAGSK